MSRFDECYPLVRQVEGGFSNHPNDAGKATQSGVTQARFNEFNRFLGFPERPVTTITDDEVRAVYHDAWLAAGCEKLPEPLDLLVFDVAINSGHNKAVVLLQRALGMERRLQIGYFGPITTKYLELSSTKELAAQYLRERVKFYHNRVGLDITQEVFLKGWLNRVGHMAQHAGIERSEYA